MNLFPCTHSNILGSVYRCVIIVVDKDGDMEASGVYYGDPHLGFMLDNI